MGRPTVFWGLHVHHTIISRRHRRRTHRTFHGKVVIIRAGNCQFRPKFLVKTFLETQDLLGDTLETA